MKTVSGWILLAATIGTLLFLSGIPPFPVPSHLSVRAELFLDADCPASLPVQDTSEEEQYVPVYVYTQDVGYCSQVSCVGDSDCETGASAYPCGAKSPYIDYPYKHFMQLDGFHDMYDLGDERILCLIDYEGGTPCTRTSKDFNLALTTTEYSTGRYISSFPDGFSIFLPPGTTSVSVNTYLPNLVDEILIVRYKKAPDGQYFDWKGNVEYDDVPVDLERTVYLDEMEQRDVFFPNRQGHAFLLSENMQVPMTTEDSGWLYVRKLPFDSDVILDLHVSFTVDVPTYTEWYESAQWDSDGNPLPLIGSPDDDWLCDSAGSQYDCFEEWCECSMGPGYWSLGGSDCNPDVPGVQTDCCCGDDPNEYLVTCSDTTGSCSSSSDSTACCPQPDNCVFDGQCYEDGDIVPSAGLCASGTWEEEPLPPSCEFTGPGGYVTSDSVPLQWTASDPAGGIFVSYSISAMQSTDNGQTYSQLAGTPLTITSEAQMSATFAVPGDGLFRFECVAIYDRGTQVSSPPGLYSVTVDTGGPALQLTGSDPELVNEETFIISWTTNSDDIDHYSLSIDGSVIDPDIPAGSTDTQYTGSPGHSYEVSLTAYDAAGNPGPPASKTVTIDTNPPACSITPLGEYVNSTTFTVQWSSTDPSGIDHYELCITDGSSCSAPSAGWTNLDSTTKSFTGTQGTTYTLSCRATDNAGNIGEWSQPESTTIDAQAPSISNQGYPSAVVSSDYGDMEVNATITDDIGIDESYLSIGSDDLQPSSVSGSPGDTEWLVTWEIPYDTYVTESGFSITMTDVNGNSDTSLFTYSVSECNPGDTRECNPTDPDDSIIAYTQGACRGSGERTCQSDGFWGNCTGGTLPVPEDCNDLDDDCDGEVDENLARQECGFSSVGICRYGYRDCVNGDWSSCSGAILPDDEETCGNSLDDDCDGATDEGCVCTDGETQPCGQSSVGNCRMGTQTCSGGTWGTCIGSILPQTETCNSLDDDCDGQVDEGCEDSGGTDQTTGEEPFPWWILTAVGVVILVVLALLWINARKHNEELTWDNLKKRFSPA